MTTQKDIAKKCGVSISAVSAAFKRPKMISPELREQILNSARELGYFSKKDEIKNIGIIIESLKDGFSNQFFSEILAGIVQTASERGISISFFEKLPDSYYEICEISGFIVVGKIAADTTKRLKKFKLNYVRAGCTDKSNVACSISADSYSGIKKLTQFILNNNHRRISIINGQTSVDDQSWCDFKNAVEDTIIENNLDIDSTLKIIQADYSDINTVEIAISQILSQNPRPTCIMCTNDFFAYYTYKILKKYKIKVGDEISVTGFDGLKLNEYIEKPYPELTTVYYDRFAIGKTSFQKLIEIIMKPKAFKRDIQIECCLKIGRSLNRL